MLQRIHLFDCNKDGYVDLLFCNAQAHLESPPAYVYADVLTNPQRTELLAEGAGTGVVADLDGDGYADLVIGNEKSGEPGHLNAFIYYGAAAGLSERYRLLLPAHRCTSATCGDFNGDGRPDLAFVADGKVRIYYQSELAFEAKMYTDLDLPAAAPSPSGARPARRRGPRRRWLRRPLRAHPGTPRRGSIGAAPTGSTRSATARSW